MYKANLLYLYSLILKLWKYSLGYKTNKSKLEIVLRRQKHATRIIYFKDTLTQSTNIHTQNKKRYGLMFLKIFFLETKNKYNTKSTTVTFYKPFMKTKGAS